MHYLLKGIRRSVWFEANGLTNINLGNLGTQVKFSDTMKYYLASLAQLSSTLGKN